MNKIKINSRCIIYLVMLMLLVPITAEAQRMKHRSGGNRNKQNISRQNTRQNKSLNGGYQKSPNRDLSKKNKTKKPNQNVKRDVNKTNIKENNRNRDRNKTNVDRNKGNRDRNRGNINIDNSKNINVINKRNTVVRPNYRPYHRPPYIYGGYRYRCYNPYRYHPYRPYYWGPVWHPWGFFVATLAVTAIVISVENQQYHYDSGVYYVESSGGYTVIQAPPGATIKVLPEGSETVVVNETTNNYYYGGTYYEKSNEGYTVVPPTAGTVVENLPEGGEEVKIGDVTYVKFGETYYQPIELDGENMYEVVNVEEDK